jgi:hypothetical protein
MGLGSKKGAYFWGKSSSGSCYLSRWLVGTLSRDQNKIDCQSPVLQHVTWGAFCEQFNTVIECLLLETITHFLYTPLVSCK